MVRKIPALSTCVDSWSINFFDNSFAVTIPRFFCLQCTNSDMIYVQKSATLTGHSALSLDRYRNCAKIFSEFLSSPTMRQAKKATNIYIWLNSTRWRKAVYNILHLQIRHKVKSLLSFPRTTRWKKSQTLHQICHAWRVYWNFLVIRYCICGRLSKYSGHKMSQFNAFKNPATLRSSVLFFCVSVHGDWFY